jgi:hypothetical protein
MRLPVPLAVVVLPEPFCTLRLQPLTMKLVPSTERLQPAVLE